MTSVAILGRGFDMLRATAEGLVCVCGPTVARLMLMALIPMTAMLIPEVWQSPGAYW